MHFSFIKAVIKQVILFLFKETSARSFGASQAQGFHTLHGTNLISAASPRTFWVAASGAGPLFTGDCSKAFLDPSRLWIWL